MNVQLNARERRVRRTGLIWGFIGTIVVVLLALIVYGVTL